MKSNVFLAVVLTLLVLDAACSENEQPEHSGDGGVLTDSGDAHDASASADAVVSPPDATVEPWTKPDILGVSTVEDANPAENIVEVNLVAEESLMTLAEDLEVPMYAYNGSIPGPVINATVGDEVIVHFENKLPEPTTIHWHGLRISDQMDGSPRIQDPVKPGETFTYRFVVNDAGSFWYHPHVRSNEQVEKGLYGVLVVHDRNAPRYDAERYFTIDDLLLTDEGIAPFLESHHEMVHGRSGNVLFVNGRADAFTFETEQHAVERWRIVNTANARSFIVDMTGAKFRVIGTDGGPLVTPYETTRLLVPVGQRYDVEVTLDQTGTAQLEMLLIRGVEVSRFPLVVANVSASSLEPRTIEWPAMQEPADRPIDREEVITFSPTQEGELRWLLNGLDSPEEPLFTFSKGDTVRFELVNQAGPEHPFHLHGQFFRVLGDESQPGLKDTVLLRGNSTTMIEAYMDNPGRWMAHCHILEHAELGMMAEIVVTDE